MTKKQRPWEKQQKHKGKGKALEKSLSDDGQFKEIAEEEAVIDKNLEELSHLKTTISMSKKGEINKLTSRFVVLPDDVVAERKKNAVLPVEIGLRERFLYSPELDQIRNFGFPQRPLLYSQVGSDSESDSVDDETEAVQNDVSDKITKEVLEAEEEKSFKVWLQSVYTLGADTHKNIYDNLPAFEQNLEVWRQLWRVLEKSDVLIIVVDIRNPLLLFPQALKQYVTEVLRKPIIVVFMKVDLVPTIYSTLWKRYFEEIFSVKVVLFSTKKKDPEMISELKPKGARSRRKAIQAALTNADKAELRSNALYLVQQCLEVFEKGGNQRVDGVHVTIGFVGAPNAGKSSLLNGLMGKKVVSVSRTCGHTKHWQTHLLHDSVNPDNILAQLCDCPGLVFPIIFHPPPPPDVKDPVYLNLLKPRHVFEVAGIFPIPQIRETYSAIRLLLERMDLARLYNLKIDPDDIDTEDISRVSPYDFLGCLADLRGYNVTKSGAPDMHRAGLEVVRDVVDGIILLAFLPPASWFEKNNIHLSVK